MRQRLHFCGQIRQVAFGLGHRQRAGREGDAGQGLLPQRRDFLRWFNAMALQQLLDSQLFRCRHFTDNDVLVRRQSKRALMVFGDLGQCTQHLLIAGIGQTALRYE